MTAWLDKNGDLYIASETVYEKLALEGWIARNEITNVNGVNLIPSRHMIFIKNAEPESPHG